MSQIGRFFQPKRLLAPAVLFLFAAVFEGDFLYKLLVDDVLMIGFMPFCAGPLFFILGIVSFTWVFPRGCKPCGVLLVDHFGVYPPEAFDAVAAAVAQPNHQASAQLGPYRAESFGSARTLVSVQLCPSCQHVGTARAELQTHDSRSSAWDGERSAPEVAVTAENAAALRALCA